VPGLVKIGPVALEKKISNDPTPNLYFCDHLPFEEDPALYLSKFEFPPPKNNLYQV
jgi:hypothetical protein